MADLARLWRGNPRALYSYEPLHTFICTSCTTVVTQCYIYMNYVLLLSLVIYFAFSLPALRVLSSAGSFSWWHRPHAGRDHWEHLPSLVSQATPEPRLAASEGGPGWGGPAKLPTQSAEGHSELHTLWFKWAKAPEDWVRAKGFPTENYPCSSSVAWQHEGGIQRSSSAAVHHQQDYVWVTAALGEQVSVLVAYLHVHVHIVG